MADSLGERVRAYKNTLSHNDDLHAEFTYLTDTIPCLKEHRDFVEGNRWGFGDRAFHYMWWLLLIAVFESFNPVKALEIGVYKGQIISLWKLIAERLRFEIAISAVSPFEGNAMEISRLVHQLKLIFNSKYRAAFEDGNLYPRSNYVADVERIFSTFNLDLTNVRLVKGYSTNAAVLKRLEGERFSIVYIDGDHSAEGVRSDILTYGPMVEDGGYMVMDDASFFLPGSSFFKGHKSVSSACEIIPTQHFVNVLNVGHNRIYQKSLNDGHFYAG
jgi:hypothetical protein